MSDETNTPELREYLAVVLRHKWLVIELTVLAIVVAVVFSYLQTPLYTASAEVLASPPDVSGVFEDASLGADNVQDPERHIATQLRLFETLEVATLAAEKAGFQGDPRDLLEQVSPKVVGTTDIIEVSATDTDPMRASATANAMAEAFVEFQAARSVATLTSLTQEISTELETTRAEFDAIDAQMNDLLSNPKASGQAQALQPKRDAALQRVTDLQRKLDELEIQSRLQQQFASIVETATTPTAPSSPKTMQNAVLAGVLGLIVGLGLAFLREQLDDTVRSAEQLESALGAPVISVVPDFEFVRQRPRPWRRKRRGALIPELLPLKDASAEAFRRLRTNIQFLGLDRPIRTLGITSSVSGDGKSTVAANSAISMAQIGLRVLLVDADLRKPVQHKVFGTQPQGGLTDVLTGDVSLDQAVTEFKTRESGARIWVLVAGQIPPNPAELLGSAAMQSLLTEMRDRFDMVVIDLPPALAVSDPVGVAPSLDGLLVVARVGASKKRNVIRVSEVIGRVQGRLIGGVLNMAGMSGSGDYDYYYDYGYESATAGANGGEKRARRNGQGKHVIDGAAHVPAPK